MCQGARNNSVELNQIFQPGQIKFHVKFHVLTFMNKTCENITLSFLCVKLPIGLSHLNFIISKLLFDIFLNIFF